MNIKYKEILGIVLTVVLLILSAELVLRRCGISRPEEITNMDSMFKTGVFVRDRILFWRFHPGARFDRPSFHYKGQLRINAFGFREREISGGNIAGVYKIFFLGGSNTCGEGMYESERFSNLLESRLNSEFKDIHFEVYNFAMPGYSTLQMYRLFKNVLIDLHPQMVIVNPERADELRLSANAPFRDSEIRILPQVPFKLLCFLETDSYIYRLVRRHMLVSFWRVKDKEGPREDMVRVTPDEHRQNLEKMSALARSNKIRIIFLASMGYENGRIVNIDKDYNCQPNIDITVRFGEKVNEGLFLDVGHINEKGHLLLSEILFDYLKSLKYTD